VTSRWGSFDNGLMVSTEEEEEEKGKKDILRGLCVVLCMSMYHGHCSSSQVVTAVGDYVTTLLYWWT
jgi:uncharacterized membrane protein